MSIRYSITTIIATHRRKPTICKLYRWWPIIYNQALVSYSTKLKQKATLCHEYHLCSTPGYTKKRRLKPSLMAIHVKRKTFAEMLLY